MRNYRRGGIAYTRIRLVYDLDDIAAQIGVQVGVNPVQLHRRVIKYQIRMLEGRLKHLKVRVPFKRVQKLIKKKIFF